jgi:hypothetical protein
MARGFKSFVYFRTAAYYRAPVRWSSGLLPVLAFPIEAFLLYEGKILIARDPPPQGTAN